MPSYRIIFENDKHDMLPVDVDEPSVREGVMKSKEVMSKNKDKTFEVVNIKPKTIDDDITISPRDNMYFLKDDDEV